jgi:hypothetical protein
MADLEMRASRRPEGEKLTPSSGSQPSWVMLYTSLKNDISFMLWRRITIECSYIVQFCSLADPVQSKEILPTTDIVS